MGIYSYLLNNAIIRYTPMAALGVMGGLAVGKTIADLFDDV